MKPLWLFRRYALLFLVLAFPPAGGLQGQSLKVEGTGWWSNFQLERNLRLFLQEVDEESDFDFSGMMDAYILLESALSSQGYLSPGIEVEATTVSGVVREFSDADSMWNLSEELQEEPLSRVVFRVDRGQRSVFSSVEFSEGSNLPIPPRVARGYFYPQNLLLPLERYRIYSVENRNSGLNNLRRALINLGYLDATVRLLEEELDKDGREVTLQIEVDAGPRYILGGLETRMDRGPEALWQADLERLRVHFGREIGSPWTPFLEREIRLSNQNALFARGYAEAEIILTDRNREIVDDDPKEQLVDVFIEAEPGRPFRVGEITLEGLQHTRPETVWREIPVESGDWFDPGRLDESRRSLYRLGIFQSVRVSSEDVSEDADDPDYGLKDIHFAFEESMRREIILRGGVGSYEKLRGGVGWEYRNLWGRAHRLRANAKGSLKSSGLGIDYTVPHFWILPVNTTIAAEWLNREEVSFDREEWSLSARLNGFYRPLGFRYYAGYALKSLNSRNFATTEAIHDTRYRSGGFDFGIHRDRRNNPVLPTRGHRWRASLDWVSPLFGAQSNYQRLHISGSHHWNWAGWQWNAGLSHEVLFSLGSDESEIPVNSRIFAGGENSIRGFREGRASPRGRDGAFIGAMQATLLNLEVERTVTPQLNAVAFYDGLLQGGRESRYPGNEFLHSAGLGLRFLTPLGPVRFEYGHNLNPREGDGSGAWHFSLGFPF